MKTGLGIQVILTKGIDLKSLILEAVSKRRSNITGLAERLTAQEISQLSSQSGTLKFTHIFGKNDKYNFGLTSVYEGVVIVEQHLLSVDNKEGLRTYYIKMGEQVDDNLFRYESSLTRNGVTYPEVSPGDGVVEVILGERRVSRNPH